MGDNRSNFITIPNFELLKTIFSSYMRDRYGFSTDTIDKDVYQKQLYTIMMDLEKSPTWRAASLKDINNAVLNEWRDLQVKEHALTPLPAKAVVKSLDRDKQLYGDRPVITAPQTILPENTTLGASADGVSKAFERVMQQRDKEADRKKPPADTSALEEPKQDAYSLEEFTSKMADLEQRREERFQANIDLAAQSRADIGGAGGGGADPSILYRTMQTTQEAEKASALQLQLENATASPMHGSIIPLQRMIEVKKYVAVNGFDRDILTQKLRYRYSVPDFNNTYRNVVSIQFTKLILPMEIVEPRTLTNTPRPWFYHDYKMSYPYVLLNIPELMTSYDGTNDAVRQSSTMFVYDNSYKSENGRGYIIMVPAQNETLTYTPTPLSTLPARMTFSITKPNGALINNSVDNYKLFKLEYTALNRTYLKVILNKYFDKNEFYKGDTVLLRHCQFDTPKDTATFVGTVGSSAYARLNDFINRREGHDIVELGQANANGYYDSFVILAPGTLDDEDGQLVIDSDLVTAVTEYNSAHSHEFCNHNDPSAAVMLPTGAVVNMSLQNVITMCIKSLSTDTTVLDTQPV